MIMQCRPTSLYKSTLCDNTLMLVIFLLLRCLLMMFVAKTGAAVSNGSATASHHHLFIRALITALISLLFRDAAHRVLRSC